MTEADDSCVVCYETYTSKYKPLKCKHHLCDTCYKDLPTKVCPCCRDSIKVRLKIPVRRATVSWLEKGATDIDNIEAYYNSKIKNMVREAIREYSNSMTDKAKHSTTIELIDYYHEWSSVKDASYKTFRGLVERANMMLNRMGLIHKIKCEYNGGRKDKKEKKYYITYDFHFLDATLEYTEN